MKDTGYNQGYITYDDEATWLVTYADLMTLLMVFFVLLYTLASFEKKQYQDKLATVQETIKENPEIEGIMKFMGRPDGFDKKIRIDEITGLRTRDSALYRSMDRMVKNSAKTEQLSLEDHSGKLVITISGEALFKSGSASLNPSAIPEINQMIGLFKEFTEYDINIKGHTDNIPIATKAFPSNWELSAIRATTVLKYLISQGINPDRLTATGYGKILPLVPNTTAENRAKNRRVEFVLEKKEKTN
ncbi:MAG: OmpA family protein [Desulfobacterales bacterium]|nr:OmpA family protein [Desulfobacterales bacterium]